MPMAYSVLDRFKAVDGYVYGNVRLLAPDCDARIQRERGYRTAQEAG
jgi:hypothetical protein